MQQQKKIEKKLQDTPLVESGHVRGAAALWLVYLFGHVIDHYEKGTPLLTRPMHFFFSQTPNFELVVYWFNKKLILLYFFLI